MKVTSNNWQTNTETVRSFLNRKEDSEKAAEESMLPDTDILDRTAEALDSLKSEGNDSDYRMKGSAPKDSVGQLAAELARAETRLDVQQVMSKAMKALANLKMSAYVCEGADAKKARQMIKRMEKLIKRIQKKLQHLSKEEQLENQRKRAEKKNEIQRAKEIQEELNTRRKKRRRDEKNYANKEMAEDAKNSAAELNSELANAISPGSSGGSPAASVSDMSGFSADMSVGEGVSIDISV